MKVSELMTRHVCLASPSQTLREAAAEMEKCDIGALPVSDNDRLVGMITDRDIAVRGISHGLGPEAPVRDVMSAEVKYCFEEDDIDNLAENMASEQIRRLRVLNGKKRLVGHHLPRGFGHVARRPCDGSSTVRHLPTWWPPLSERCRLRARVPQSARLDLDEKDVVIFDHQEMIID